MTGTRCRRQETQAAAPTPPPELGPVDFSQTTLGPQYVTVWDLPEKEFPITRGRKHQRRLPTARPMQATDASGIEAALPAVIKATLAGDAREVAQAGAPFGVATLHDASQPRDVALCPATKDLCITTIPLAPASNGGEYWAAVTGGQAVVPPGSPLAMRCRHHRLASPPSANSPASFDHFVAVYERYGDGSWSDELARADLTNATPDCCYLVGVSWGGGGVPLYGAADALVSSDPAWQRLRAAMTSTGISTAGLETPSRAMTSLPMTAQSGAPTGWLVLSGNPYMATFAAIFYVLRFEPETRTLAVVEAKSDRRWGGALVDVDGDGVPEVLMNQGNAYVFGAASGADEAMFRLLHWRDGELVDVPFEVPAGLSDEVSGRVDHVLKLVGADLWTDAAAEIADAVSMAPQNDDLTWLARRIQLIAMARLLQVVHQEDRDPPTLRAPLLMMAGEYEAVVDMMREYSPEELFDPAQMRPGATPPYTQEIPSPVPRFDPAYPFAE